MSAVEVIAPDIEDLERHLHDSDDAWCHLKWIVTGRTHKGDVLPFVCGCGSGPVHVEPGTTNWTWGKPCVACGKPICPDCLQKSMGR